MDAGDDEQLRTKESVEEFDPFTLYLSDIRAHPILTSDEEQHYHKLAQKGDIAARNHFVKCNLRLVVKISRRFVNRGLSISDLVSEGNFGLFKAITKFKPTLGYKFSTYATWWINQAISHAISNKARTIRVPIHILNVVNKYKKAWQKLPDTKKDKSDQVSKVLNITVEKTRRLQELTCDVISYDCETYAIHEDGDFMQYNSQSNLSSDDSFSPEPTYEAQESRTRIAEILNILTVQERDVIFKRYGFETGSSQTLEDISKKYDRTRERIRQIQEVALEKLKAHFKDNNLKLDSYL